MIRSPRANRDPRCVRALVTASAALLALAPAAMAQRDIKTAGGANPIVKVADQRAMRTPIQLTDQQKRDLRGRLTRIDDAARAKQPNRPPAPGAIETATLAFTEARELQTQVAFRLAQPEELASIFDKYAIAAESGTARQAALVQNSVGSLLLRQNLVEQAAAQFRAIDVQAVDVNHRFAVQFNTGAALELAGDRSAAHASYIAAARAQPQFDDAGISALRVCAQGDWATPAVVQQTARAVTLRHQKVEALPFVYDYLAKRPENEDVAPATDVAERFLADGVGLVAYERRERARLSELGERTPVRKRWIDTIDAVYRASFGPLVTGNMELERILPNVERPDAELSALLLRTGNDYAWDPEKQAEAAGRYIAAWRIDRRNGEAALLAAGVLAEPAGRLDVTPRVLAELGRPMRDPAGRGARERRGFARPRVPDEELVRIYRKHLLLASVYAQQKNWGSAAWIPRSDPRAGLDTSALGQLGIALWMESLLAARSDDHQPSPYLRTRLAAAYRAADQPKPAYDAYIEAAKLFRERGMRGDAAEVMAEAEQYRIEITGSGRGDEILRGGGDDPLRGGSGRGG